MTSLFNIMAVAANNSPSKSITKKAPGTTLGTLNTINARAANGSFEAAYGAGIVRDHDAVLFLNLCIDVSGSMFAGCGGGKTRLQVKTDWADGGNAAALLVHPQLHQPSRTRRSCLTA